ncbi:MAG: hypothetical protein A2261_02910 [Candidatus Magasanikbacteria bacterium RIFOXYA2_FULL_44_8]|uniref:Polymerase nucleotidyl transferase domain-containing protein n=1 Tax=Candidatus Magasanikbacteria bacterium RIFOXYA2_FULL_44_8 TaxID=1798696 RepID=A0A1F6NJY3_9BACT|nr:MAG: hypothetical protein A2261_02910 [Candidatus Magasanikbacteria bacterium RIFOXYA2_FULL_44_8]
MQKELEQSILKTLAYFDIANYPLTKEEIFRYLWQPPRLSCADFLAQFFEQNMRWQEKYGYYFLPGREEIMENRRRRLVASARKLKKAKRAAGLIASVPFLAAIFVCNSVATEQARPDSDIDFFIVTTPGRIWIVRFFTNLILRIFGLRTYGQKRADRICLSFFVDSDHLNLRPHVVADSDIHFIYWLQQMVPLYDSNNLYNKFLQANNWIANFTPHVGKAAVTVSSVAVTNSAIGRWWKNIWGRMWHGSYGDMVENQAKQLQMHAMKKTIKQLASVAPKNVVIADGVIKLHETDTREEYLKNWKQKLIEIC